MICTSCGAEVAIEAVYCHKCGERLAAEQEAENPGPTGVEAPDAGAKRAPQPSRSPLRPDTAPDDDVEEDLWEGGYSSKAMFGTWILAGLLTVAALIGGVFLIGTWWTGWAILLGVLAVVWIVLYVRLILRQWGVHYHLTNQRFVHQVGILRRTTDRVEVIDMDDITYEQGLIERMVGVGTIKVTSSDRTHPELILVGIDRVQEMAETMDNARRKERVRRGLHIETI